MSGFFEDIPDMTDMPSKSASARKIKPVRDLGARGCDACPRKTLWPTLASPRMEMTGARDADILVLGTAPDKEEDGTGEPFTNSIGKLLKTLIPTRELYRIVFQNSIRCHAPGEATQDVLHSCSVHTEEEVLHSGIKLIIGVGQAPLSLYYPGAVVWKIYGTRFVVKIGPKLVWYYPVMDPGPMQYLATQQDKKVEYLSQWAVLRADLKQLFKNYDSWPEPSVAYIDTKLVQLPDTFEEALALVKTMTEPIGLDIETTELKPYLHNQRILCVAFSDGITTIAVPLEHSNMTNMKWRKDGIRLLTWVISYKRWIAHNAAFELKWLRYFISSIIKPFDCSQALGRLYHQREHGLSLANMSRIHLGIDIKQLSNLDVKRLDEYPTNQVLVYCGLDALGCRLIYDKLYKTVINTQKVGYKRLIGAAESTVYMEEVGLSIDIEQAKEFDRIWTTIVGNAATKIRGMYEVHMYERNVGKEFKPGSTSQLAEALTMYGGVRLPKNPKTGAYMVDEETLRSVAEDHPLVNAVLEYRGAVKQKSTYIDPVLIAPVIYVDGIIHPGYTTMHTATLRLSGEDPNIQNWPKRKHREIRKIIVAPKRYVIVPVDEGQLEVRILAMASKDPVLCKFIIDGFDMHSFWLDKCLEAYPEYIDKLAMRTNEADEKKIRKAGRDTIKTDFVFASFFGSGPPSVAARTDIPIHKVIDLQEELWDMFKGVKKWQKERRIEYEETGSIKTLTNRVRHDILNGNEPYNTPIQGTGSDLVIDAQNELYQAAVEEDDMHLAPRINIHDDLTFILPDNDEKLEYYFSRIAESMTKVRYDFQIVPLMVEFKIGYNWCDVKDIYTHTGDYIK